MNSNGALPLSEKREQIEAKALRKLKHPSRSRKLRSFLDN
jgi:DNA-directed RNA polymerase sigma subunit (sigma70/sigma32)